MENIRNMGITKNVIIPNQVKVIKTLKNGITQNNYYSGYIKEKQHIYSFLNYESANNYSLFLGEFKSIYGDWPSNSQPGTVLKNKRLQFSERRSPLEIKETDIIIKDEKLENMQKYCVFNNLGLLGVTFFEYSIFDYKIDLYISACSLLSEDITIEQNDSLFMKINSLNSIWFKGEYSD